MEPPDLSKCPHFLKKWLELVVKYARSRTPLQGIGVYVADAVGDTGRILTTQPPVNGASGPGYFHNYQIADASNGINAAITVSAGNHFDSSTGNTWIPTINSVYITNAIPPALSVTNTTTVCYFEATVNPLDGSGATPIGAITALTINAGSSVPNSTNVYVRQLCSQMIVSIGSNSASVANKEGGVSGSQNYFPCGSSPTFCVQ